jgi:hypothetical protein
MDAINAFFGLFIGLSTIVLFYRLRKLEPQIAGYGTQTICPSCGLITSRLKASCLECGKSLTPVLYSVTTK